VDADPFGRAPSVFGEGAASGRLARLSIAALRHGQEVRELPVGALAARLYAANRLPAAVGAGASVHLDRAERHARTTAGRDWTEAMAEPPGSWRFWRPRTARSAPVAGMWKLYVSPSPSMLAEAVRAAFAALDGLDVLCLKYSADAPGLLRPDKLVVHFATADAMQAAAARMARSLAGCPVHGVPFTAELGGDGLLSCGFDPPAASIAASLGPSWRAWVTRLLAEALCCPDAGDLQPWQRALQAAAAAGVDPVTWAPAPDIWERSPPASGTGAGA
jgi:hypothetical protein